MLIGPKNTFSKNFEYENQNSAEIYAESDDEDLSTVWQKCSASNFLWEHFLKVFKWI
jgi:hypothetical protein